MESNEGGNAQQQQPETVGGSGYQTAVLVPPLQGKSTGSGTSVVGEQDEQGYNEKSGEHAPLLGTNTAGRDRRIPRKQCIWNIVMAVALLATIVLIVLLVLLSSNAAKEDGGDGDTNSTVLETGFELPFRMLQATGDGTDAGGGVDDPGAEPAPVPAPDPPVIPTPRNDTSAPAPVNGTTPSPIPSSAATNATSAPTTIAPTPTTTPEPPLDTSIQVQVDQGLLQGVRFNSSLGREYLAFLGVPYAQPPIGNFRFKEPIEADVWNGTYNATKYQPGCVGEGGATGIDLSEDCLYLNVYTPKNSSELSTNNRGGGFGGGGFGRRGRQTQSPVIVYLTGDGNGGNADAKAVVDHFMTENVTVVTLNYRVGIYGTLNLNTSNAAGNQGLKDQAMALKWVKDNIREFGGNRRKLTLFGAPGIGSAHVTAHLLSPSSDSTFKRVVVNSGSVLQQSYFTPLSKSLSYASAMGSSLNCSTNLITVAVTEQLATCFQNKTVAELETAATVAGYNVRLTIDAAAGDANGEEENENDGDGDGSFFPDTPVGLLANGSSFQQVPAIVITSSSHSMVAGQPKWSVSVIEDEQGNSTQLTIALDELTSFIQLPEQNTNETNRQILNQIQDFYFNQTTSTDANGTAANGSGTRTVDINNPAVLANATNLYADRMLNHPAVAVAQGLYLANNGSGGGGRGGGEGIFGNLFGGTAGQGVYLLHENVTAGNGFDAGGFFSETMKQLLTSFADTGVPSAIDPSGQNITWTPINNQTRPYQALWLDYVAPSGNNSATATNSTAAGTNSSSYSFQMDDFFGERIQFWDAFNLTDIYA